MPFVASFLTSLQESDGTTPGGYSLSVIVESQNLTGF